MYKNYLNRLYLNFQLLIMFYDHATLDSVHRLFQFNFFFFKKTKKS